MTAGPSVIRAGNPRTIGLAASMLALALTGGLGLVAKQRAREAHGSAQEQRARLTRLIVEVDSLHDAADEAPRLLPLLIGGDVTEASVGFIELVTQASARALFHADQVSSRVDTIGDGALLITASVTARADDAALLRFLSTLESAAPLASVRRVALRRTAGDGPSVVEVEVAGFAVLDLATGLSGARGSTFGNLPPALQLAPDTVYRRWLRTALGGLTVESPAAEESVEQSLDAPSPVEAPVLKGLVGGPPWIAIVAGIEGVSGAVLLAEGDTAAGVTAIEVSATGASLSRGDQVWRLRLPGEEE